MYGDQASEQEPRVPDERAGYLVVRPGAAGLLG